MIELDGIKKTYKGRCVLDIPKLTLQKGVRYAVIGPNGSGKSTLLRIIAGTLEADDGKVTFSDEGIKSEIGYMPQAPYVFNMNVTRNVEIAFNRSPDAKKMSLSALDKVGMTHLQGAWGTTLSGGEKQRMVVARMIAKPHSVLILDEPTSATDIVGNDLIEGAINEYVKENNCTLIFTTHLPSQAERLGDEVLILSEGRLVEMGDVKSVLRNPQHEDTKLFLKHWKL
jgi:ABC-type multidrug transport system ATPase subunit